MGPRHETSTGEHEQKTKENKSKILYLIYNDRNGKHNIQFLSANIPPPPPPHIYSSLNPIKCARESPKKSILKARFKHFPSYFLFSKSVHDTYLSYSFTSVPRFLSHHGNQTNPNCYYIMQPTVLWKGSYIFTRRWLKCHL